MALQTRAHLTETDSLPLETSPRPTKVKSHIDVDALMYKSPAKRIDWYPPLKTALDVTAAAVLMVFAAPLILISALLVKLTSAGPAFYTQTRVGKNGRLFTIYKIRTMIHNAEALTGPRWSLPGDPRITWMGYILRVTHMDELPQLLNVLVGEMSLIGPRPERPEFVPELQKAFPSYVHRLSVKPGVTGLAQVQLPSDTDLESVRHKLAHDLYYVENQNPILDMKIVLCTALYAFGVPFRYSRRFFNVPTQAEVERAFPVEALGRTRKSA